MGNAAPCIGGEAVHLCHVRDDIGRKIGLAVGNGEFEGAQVNSACSTPSEEVEANML